MLQKNFILFIFRLLIEQAIWPSCLARVVIRCLSLGRLRGSPPLSGMVGEEGRRRRELVNSMPMLPVLADEDAGFGTFSVWDWGLRFTRAWENTYFGRLIIKSQLKICSFFEYLVFISKDFPFKEKKNFPFESHSTKKEHSSYLKYSKYCLLMSNTMYSLYLQVQ